MAFDSIRILVGWPSTVFEEALWGTWGHAFPSVHVNTVGFA